MLCCTSSKKSPYCVAPLVRNLSVLFCTSGNQSFDCYIANVYIQHDCLIRDPKARSIHASLGTTALYMQHWDVPTLPSPFPNTCFTSDYCFIHASLGCAYTPFTIPKYLHHWGSLLHTCITGHQFFSFEYSVVTRE